MEDFLFKLFVVISLILIVFFFKRKKKRIKGANYIDPMTIFTGGLFVYAFIGASDRIGLYENDLLTPVLFYLSVIFGYISFSIAYINTVKADKSPFEQNKVGFSIFPKSIKLSDKESIAMLLFFVVIVTINISTFVDMIVNFGTGVAYADVALRGARTATSGPLALLESFFSLAMIGLPIYNMLRTGKVSLIDAFILFIYFVYSIVCGYRTTLVSICIALAVFYNFRIKKISLKTILVGGVVALFFLVVLGHLRAESSIEDMAAMFSSSDKDLFNVENSGEFSNTVETCYTYIENSAFNYGYSWILEVLMYIPVFLWPDRPLPLPEQYMKIYFPSAPDGYGKGWFVLTDGYSAFGIFGVIIEMFIIGMVLAKLYNYFMKRKDSYFLMMIYVFFLVNIFIMIRGSFLSFVKNFTLSIIPLILIHFFFGKRRKNTYL